MILPFQGLAQFVFKKRDAKHASPKIDFKFNNNNYYTIVFKHTWNKLFFIK